MTTKSPNQVQLLTCGERRRLKYGAAPSVFDFKNTSTTQESDRAKRKRLRESTQDTCTPMIEDLPIYMDELIVHHEVVVDQSSTSMSTSMPEEMCSTAEKEIQCDIPTLGRFSIEANKRYLMNVVLPCLMSAILILLIGISSLRLWNKFKRRRVEKETQELDDIPELHNDEPSSPSALQTPRTGERQPEDTYAHTTFGIYNHVSLRVQYSKESVYDTGKRPDIDESPPCPGLPPDTIFEQDEEPVHDRQKDSQSESDDSENEYFNVSYARQVLCNVQESSGQTSSLTSNSSIDNEDVSDYVNWESMQEGHFYGSEVYSCNEDVMLHKQH